MALTKYSLTTIKSTTVFQAQKPLPGLTKWRIDFIHLHFISKQSIFKY